MPVSGISKYTPCVPPGFEACGFADGAAFWQALQTEEQPELVVLDVMLPGVDGMELLRRMPGLGGPCAASRW